MRIRLGSDRPRRVSRPTGAAEPPMRSPHTRPLIGVILALTLAVSVLGGCRKSANCDAIVEHVSDLFVQEESQGKQLSPEDLKELQDRTREATRSDLYEECKKKAWTTREEQCIVSATTVEAVGRCDVPK